MVVSTPESGKTISDWALLIVLLLQKRCGYPATPAMSPVDGTLALTVAGRWLEHTYLSSLGNSRARILALPTQFGAILLAAVIFGTGSSSDGSGFASTY